MKVLENFPAFVNKRNIELLLNNANHIQQELHRKNIGIRLVGRVGKVFANGPGDLGSIPGRVIPNTLKTVLDTSLLNTQQYKVRIKDKVEQSTERSSPLSYISV